MAQSLAGVALVVREYDEAIAYFTQTLGFDLLEDTPLPGGKRWVRVRPPGSGGTSLLLARAARPANASRTSAGETSSPRATSSRLGGRPRWAVER